MGKVRSTVTTALDGVIGRLWSVRDRIAEEESDAGGEPSAEGPAADVPADLPATADTGGVPATDDGDGGIAGTLKSTVTDTVSYQLAALRHPLTAQRVHFAALSESAGLNSQVLKEATLLSPATMRDRRERIRREVESEGSVVEDAKSAAGEVDWSRTWLYGKAGYAAGRRYGDRLPVQNAYAPAVGAVAGGAYGAVTSATDYSLIEVDPDRLFDRLDALARLRDDPVSRASAAREVIHELDRRLGDEDDPLPVDDVVDDADIAEAVTTGDEAVPDEIPLDPATQRLVTRDLSRTLPPELLAANPSALDDGDRDRDGGPAGDEASDDADRQDRGDGDDRDHERRDREDPEVAD